MGTVLHGKTLYDVLGVANTATKKEIKAQFYRLSMLYHPDSTSCHSEEPQSTVWRKEKFIQISHAYSVLSDEGERRAYDQKLGIPLWKGTNGGIHVGRRAPPRHSAMSQDWPLRQTTAGHREGKMWEHMRRWETLRNDSKREKEELNMMRNASRIDQRHDRQASRNRWLALALTVALYFFYSDHNKC